MTTSAVALLSAVDSQKEQYRDADSEQDRRKELRAQGLDGRGERDGETLARAQLSPARALTGGSLIQMGREHDEPILRL